MAVPKNIRIGTSGYSFLDWVGPFYPQGIEKGKMLDYYVNHFDVVEINSSYYSIPHPKVFENMEKKTPPNFEFIVKTHKSLTHDRTDIFIPTDQYKDAIKPLVDAGKLRGLLLQFPYSFKWTQQNFEYLKKATHMLAPTPLYLEFRYRGWLRDELFDWCSEKKINICSIDGPQIDSMPRDDLHQTSQNIYLRLHGRNAEKWWKGGPLRYDYLYSEDQLRDWIDKIRKSKKELDTLYVFFNNCHAGQAVQNARMMADLLRLEFDDED